MKWSVKGKGKSLWRKVSDSSLKLDEDRPRVKPGEEIWATEKELGDHISEFDLLEATSEKIDESIPNEYTVEHKGGGWYDIISPTGKKMNEDSLKVEEANKRKRELEGND